MLSFGPVDSDIYGKPISLARYELLQADGSVKVSNDQLSVVATCESPCTSLAFTDVAALSQLTDRAYRVRAIGVDGQAGALGENFPNGASVRLERSVTPGNLRLEWDPVTTTVDGSPTTVVAYEVWESTVPFDRLDIELGVTPTLIGTTGDAFLEITDPGVTRYYSVLTIDAGGNKSPSDAGAVGVRNRSGKRSVAGARSRESALEQGPRLKSRSLRLGSRRDESPGSDSREAIGTILSETSDADLVALAIEGDERAFEAILTRHQARVMRMLRLLGTPRSDRDDLAQDVFVRVFRHLSGFNRNRAFEPWLYRITVNVAHDHRKRQRRSKEDPVADPRELDDVAAGEPTPDDRAMATDQARRLERALDGLSSRERAVFVLVELEQLTTKEAAKSLGINQITVRRHLGRARERLARLVAESR